MSETSRAEISRQPTGPWPVHFALGAALMLELLRRLSGRETLAPEDRERVLLYAILGISLNPAEEVA